MENVDKNTLESTLKACGERLTWWAYICHDKDKKDNGEPKKAHWHLLLEWECSDHHAKENITKAFKPLYTGFESQLIIESVKSINKQARYLMHLDNKEKAQYRKEQVHTSDMDTYESYIATTIKEKEIDKMLDELLDKCLERYEKGEEIDNGYILLYFKRLGRLDYYLKNNQRIYNMIREYLQVMTTRPF